MVDRRQTEYWDEISEQIEASIKHNDPATAYAMFKRLRGGKAASGKHADPGQDWQAAAAAALGTIMKKIYVVRWHQHLKSDTISEVMWTKKMHSNTMS